MDYIIVTGTSRGLGAALVKEALRNGASVIAVSRRQKPSTITSAKLPQEKLTWIHADLESAVASADGYAELTGKIEIAIDRAAATSVTLINNAATLEPIGLTGSEMSDFSGLSSAVNLNITVPILLTNWFVRSFGPVSSLPPKTIRTVVNISSGASERVMPGLATYSATKAAINAFTASAAAEAAYLQEQSDYAFVRIVAVSPGAIDTDMQVTLRSKDSMSLPDHHMYARWYENGTLKSAEKTARRILTLLADGDLPQGEFMHIDRMEEEGK